ncbi:hypothetical protein [Ktedonobacter racemifer]|uniref:Haloacid dehalogenase domain protein hydrolase n=1 Tax=Ktedonobacter racemifer DSM 44963 TaxID=485913 RepID=D6U694_KTERA|nr:hypothetical protein [Ktedonobacter racemifer]EFH80505.1 hypothetical protein Krac_1114 [Ktedonobacter racemifer DSM 44963]
MLFALDIDRTIAIDQNAYAIFINTLLNLSISQEVLMAVESYWAFCKLPEVEAYRFASPENEERFQAAFMQAKEALEVLALLHPLPGAAAGVQTLMRYGKVAYYTSRGFEMQDTTRAWLAQHDFPLGLEIVSCKNFYVKYMASYSNTKATNEPVVLIDDNASKLISAWPRALEKWPVLDEYPSRLTLVAFGTPLDELSIHDVPFPVLGLPSWEPEHIQSLLDRVLLASHKEESTHDH